MLINAFKKIRRYGFWGGLRLVRDILASRAMFSGVRVIRHPWYVRGGAHIQFGKNFTSGVGLRVDAFGAGDRQIVFGDNVQVGDYVHIAAMCSVVLGDNVLIASKVYISDHDHGLYSGSADVHTRPDQVQMEKRLSIVPVVIASNVWIGENVCILKGVEVGRNSIIGASSVVTRSVPADSIVVGNPARVIKRYDHILLRWVDSGANN
jgi:lipopolysaccharide O-acetyltransferase